MTHQPKSNQQPSEVGDVSKKPKLEDFPHLIDMEKEIKRLTPGTVRYWKERCINLEKSLDPTYSDFERSNCNHFYRILVKKAQ